MEFYKLIDELLAEFGITGYRLAESAGLDVSTVSNWRRRNTKRPQTETMRLIEQTLNIEFEYDLEGIPVGWHKCEFGTVRQDTANNADIQPKKRDIVKKSANRYTLPRMTDQPPAGVADMYGDIPFYGTKVPWDELPEEIQSQLELEFNRVLIEREALVRKANQAIADLESQFGLKAIELLSKFNRDK